MLNASSGKSLLLYKKTEKALDDTRVAIISIPRANFEGLQAETKWWSILIDQTLVDMQALVVESCKYAPIAQLASPNITTTLTTTLDYLKYPDYIFFHFLIYQSCRLARRSQSVQMSPSWESVRPKALDDLDRLLNTLPKTPRPSDKIYERYSFRLLTFSFLFPIS